MLCSPWQSPALSLEDQNINTFNWQASVSQVGKTGQEDRYIVFASFPPLTPGSIFLYCAK